MKLKSGKFAAIVLLVALALAVSGAGFAHWSQTLTINGDIETGELDWEFVSCSVLDESAPPPYYPTDSPDYTCNLGFELGPQGWFWKLDKNVAWGEQELVDSDDDGDKDTLKVTLHEAYPCYFNSVSFYVHNNGSVPLKVEKVIINGIEITGLPAPVVGIDCNGDDKADVEISWNDNFGVQFDPCIPNPAEFSFWIHVLQDAPPGEELSFTIQVVGVQWNKYTG